MVKRTNKDEIAVPAPDVPEMLGDTQNDEYRGHGGSYVIDPATGKRIRVEGPGAAVDDADAELAITNEEKTDEIE